MSLLLLPFKLIGFVITTLLSFVGGVFKFALGFVFVVLLLLALVVFGVLHLIF